MSLRHCSLPPFLAVRRLLATLGVLILAQVSAAAALAQQQYTDIRSLGTSNAVYRPGPRTPEELQARFREYRDDYAQVLRDAGWPGNPDDLFRAVEQGQFSEARYPVGHTFEWMAVRKRGMIQPTGPVRWAGSEPFDAYEIRFESNDQEHRFLVPHACGNLALVAMRDVEPEIDLEAITPTLRVQAPNNCTGVNVTVDVTVGGPGIPEGGSLRLVMTRPSGQRETLDPSQAGAGYRWQGQLDEAGTYLFSASVDTPIGPTEQVTERITLDPCEPTCNIALNPPPPDSNPRAGEDSIGIDMCQSSAEIGNIASRTVEVYLTPVDGPEQLVETLSLDDNCSTDWVMPEYGTYRFHGQVEDDRGMRSTCEATYTLIEPEAELLPFFTAFAGNERRWRSEPVIGDNGERLFDRSAPLAGGTIGVMYAPTERFGIFGQGGVAANLRDSEYTSVFADFGANALFEGGYFGGGVGIWDINNSDTRDGTIFVHGGFNITERLQWNFEGRLFMDMLDMIDDNYVYLTGIRFFWTRE